MILVNYLLFLGKCHVDKLIAITQMLTIIVKEELCT